MSSDPNKKSARTFQCRDALWETFEQMAQELECSVDYLICEAMKQYARQGARLSSPQPAIEAPPSRTQAQPALPPLPPAPPPSHGRASALPPLPPPPSRAPASLQHAPPPPPPGRMSRPVPAAPVPAAPVAAPAVPRLSVIYAGEKFPITKNQFVIGRGKQSSDLTIRDPNISRQHAMIEQLNGQYFMVDLGSTNGVEYHGQRIARKQIAEGDVFTICNHQIQFTYR